MAGKVVFMAALISLSLSVGNQFGPWFGLMVVSAVIVVGQLTSTIRIG